MKLRSGWAYPGNGLRVGYIKEENGYHVEAYLWRTKDWSIFVLGSQRAEAIKYYQHTVHGLNEEEAEKEAKKHLPWYWLF